MDYFVFIVIIIICLIIAAGIGIYKQIKLLSFGAALLLIPTSIWLLYISYNKIGCKKGDVCKSTCDKCQRWWWWSFLSILVLMFSFAAVIFLIYKDMKGDKILGDFLWDRGGRVKWDESVPLEVKVVKGTNKAYIELPNKEKVLYEAPRKFPESVSVKQFWKYQTADDVAYVTPQLESTLPDIDNIFTIDGTGTVVKESVSGLSTPSIPSEMEVRGTVIGSDPFKDINPFEVSDFYEYFEGKQKGGGGGGGEKKEGKSRKKSDQDMTKGGCDKNWYKYRNLTDREQGNYKCENGKWVDKKTGKKL